MKQRNLLLNRKPICQVAAASDLQAKAAQVDFQVVEGPVVLGRVVLAVVLREAVVLAVGVEAEVVGWAAQTCLQPSPASKSLSRM